MRLPTSLTALAAYTALTSFPLPQRNAPDFRPLEFLVGDCWIGTFPDGKQTDEHCFEWVYDRKFIRDRHVVRNGQAPYAGETLYGWDARAKRLAFWYFNSEGDVILGTVEYQADSIVFPTRYETDKGPVDLRAAWTRTGADSYRVAQSQREGEAWKPLWGMELRRRDAATDDPKGPGHQIPSACPGSR
jgi:hypothetical protein